MNTSPLQISMPVPGVEVRTETMPNGVLVSSITGGRLDGDVYRSTDANQHYRICMFVKLATWSRRQRFAV